MSASVDDRPAPPLQLPDRRLSRRLIVRGNTRPWHPVTNPNGCAGVRFPGPELAQR